MKIKSRVPAFTILEMVITMMISALIMGFALTAYLLILRANASIQQKNGWTVEVLQLDKTIQRDIDRGLKVLKTTNGIMITDSADSVSYAFNAAYIVRISRRIDTTKLQVEDLQTVFEQQPAEKGLVDEISFKVTCNQQTIFLIFHKYYSSADLFNNTPYAIY
jgi:type II secretory pathway component PulJ